MSIKLVPSPIAIDLDASLFSALSDAQLGLYMRLVWLCNEAPGSIAKIVHALIPSPRLQELRRLGLIRCTPGLAWSYVSIVQEGVDGAWWRCLE